MDICEAATELYKLAKQDAPIAPHKEITGGSMPCRILIERSHKGGQRVILADDQWLRDNNSYNRTHDEHGRLVL